MGSEYNNIVQGDKKLLRTMKKMRTSAARAVMSTGAAKAAQVLAKAAKAEVPARMKEAKKGIGWKRLTKSDAPDGGAKIGSKVGRTGQKAKKDNARLRQKGRGGKSGVGMGPANVHWVLLGTKNRKSKNPRRSTGSTPPYMRPITAIAASNKSGMFSAFQKGAWGKFKELVKENKAF